MNRFLAFRSRLPGIIQDVISAVVIAGFVLVALAYLGLLT